MKIVHICLAGPVTDGWNYQDNMITKYHEILGHSVTMITSQWVWGTNGNLEKNESTDYYNSDGVKVIRLPLKGQDKFTKKFKWYQNLRGNLEKEKPDILFIHNVSFMDVKTIVSFLKRNKNVKVFVDNHADFSNSATGFVSKNILHKLIWRHMAQSLVPYSEKFYGVLPARVNFLIDMYGVPANQTELLVMGADDEKVVEAQNTKLIEAFRQKYAIKKDDFLIVTGGKIDKAKMQTINLMQAVKNTSQKNVKLLVFGSIEECLKEQVNRLVDDKKIQYIGWVNSNDSYKIFAAANLVVFPGRHSVFWEQVVGQGKPMICKFWDGTTHVDLGGNVEFLYTDSVEEIMGKIQLLLSNKEYFEKMKKVAEEKGSLIFSYKEISKKSIQSF
ncbi:glycosyltransferase [Priestia megaterium]|uniref:glycosyltransferase n=1 Tax=Priestia TaxID=2800373 RepID=UPI0035E179E0